MIVPLRHDPVASSGDEATDLLLECHGRIRRFSALALRLARAVGVAPGEIADAARSLARYHTVALPLHQQDEDVSVLPRLITLDIPNELALALERMAGQHIDLERVIGELVPHWEALDADPGRIGELATRMAKPAEQLEQMWRVHLALEEQVVFPAIPRLLQADERAALVAEMRARRAPKS